MVEHRQIDSQGAGDTGIGGIARAGDGCGTERTRISAQFVNRHIQRAGRHHVGAGDIGGIGSHRVVDGNRHSHARAAGRRGDPTGRDCHLIRRRGDHRGGARPGIDRGVVQIRRCRPGIGADRKRTGDGNASTAGLSIILPQRRAGRIIQGIAGIAAPRRRQRRCGDRAAGVGFQIHRCTDDGGTIDIRRGVAADQGQRHRSAAGLAQRGIGHRGRIQRIRRQHGRRSIGIGRIQNRTASDIELR